MSDPAEDDEDRTDRVVTAFLRNRGEVLLARRSDAVGTDEGRWGGVSGLAEGGPDEQVRVEIREETGLEPGTGVSLVRSGRPVRVEDAALGRERVVHPYLFDCDSREVTPSEEHDAFEWVSPTAILEGDRETVPALWTAYERVAPTVRSIAADDEHGAAFLSIRALEALRDRAGVLIGEREGDGPPGTPDSEAEWDELAGLARRLLEARPAMVVLRNRVNRAMAGADEAVGVRDAATVLESATAGIELAIETDERAAARAAERADGAVLTVSRSGTVLEALRAGDPDRVYVAESRPAREGVGVAERLADAGVPVAVHTDAAAAHVLAQEDIDCVLVGADAVLPDGRVVNKTGTRAVAVAAAREGVAVYAVAASDKVSTREAIGLEAGDAGAVYDGPAAVDALNPTFDVTPADCVTAVLTERGALSPDEVEAVADEVRTLEAWREG